MLQTPAQRGFVFPAEWHKHAATWLTFPWNDASWQGSKRQQMYPAYMQFIKTITQGEKVCFNVPTQAKSVLLHELGKAGIDLAQIEILENPTNDAWCRDHGPAFLINQATQERLVVNWEHNAWGGKYPPFDDDNCLPEKIARYRALEFVTPNIIMEGGSVEFNGKGTVLTSRSCLLNPNRNSHLNQGQIEQYLHDYYGVDQVLWVNDGIVGDDTDGHIDDTVRFVNQDTVIAMVEANKNDENYTILQENLRLLKNMRLLNGKPLNVVEVQMPDAVVIDDFRTPGSYANFYICNAGVLVPTYRSQHDQAAIDTLSKLITDRPVIGIDATDIIWGQGSFHCLSQQEPI